MNKNETFYRLGYLRAQADNECISYGEIAELQEYHDEIRELDDVVLAEIAGIPEDEWNKTRNHEEKKL